MYRLKIIVAFALWLTATCSGKNIVLIITDDQDSVLNGMEPMQFTRKLIANEGVEFKKAFAAVPICCPNRASILTGRYQHNHRTFNNSIAGGCNSDEWRNIHEKNTFAAVLKQQMRYNTFYAGKYLNEYGEKSTGGVAHIPPGWDKWYGLVGNSKYYNYTLSNNGREEWHGTRQSDYLTDVIWMYASQFLKGQKADKPFLMVLAPPAPHEPFTAPTRYVDKYKGKIKVPRNPNFNTDNPRDKHWLVRMGMSPLPVDVTTRLDDIYRKRWESLLAVDEMVNNVYTTLAAQNLLNDTYIIYTSDNGFHIGQFSMPYDKRQPYETDIRVPLMMRGPGIVRGTEVKSAVSSVDLFATILEIAGVERPSDGVSLLNYEVLDRTVLVEYHGEKSHGKSNSGCPTDADLNLALCHKDFACKCQDAANNTYTCVRRVAEHYNNVFCLFYDDEHFVEYYDMINDQFQLTNLGPRMNSGQRYRFRKRVKKMSICKDATCILTNPPYKAHAH
ncbi:N-acetylglucosamine-6-sulfatase-like [Phymastichus coffea]|uniref:N-acetylglucosamine-6-sulfatase-like n=1 Tax=Phymastichus coffea TaxID=108790 RepID=UPI00273ABD06|nr:N-acetylglucosamine-6-sulfatase-like [Phymastichus coffea]